MKNLYAVIVIANAHNLTADEYIAAYANATPIIVEGLQAVFDYCGGKLYRGRAGYGGMRDGTSFYAYRIK